MRYTDAIGKGSSIIKKNYWLFLIPISSDALLLCLNYLTYGIFMDSTRMPMFQLKFTMPSAIPSLKNMVDTFPDLMSWNSSTGFQSSILSFYSAIPPPWNKVYALCGVLAFSIFTAFLHGGFLGSIAKTYREDEKAGWKDFMHYGRHYWSRFLCLQIIGTLAMVLALAFIPIVFIYFFIALLMFYLAYALVWDDVAVTAAISNAIGRFTSRLGNSLGFIIYVALLLGLASVVIIPLARYNAFLGSISYNLCACCMVAGTLVMYAGEKAEPGASLPPDENNTGFDVRI